MAAKSKTPGARGRTARAQRRRAAQQQVRAGAGAQAQALGAATADTLTLADDERQPCEVWTRVMGYHRPVAGFNAGKQAEHAERRFFKLPNKERQ